MITALLLALAPTQADFAATLRVEDGETLCTLAGRGVRVEDALRRLAHLGGRTIEGLEGSRGDALVDLDLRDRPFEQCLRVLAGCAGLDARLDEGAIVLSAPSDAAEQAELAWLRAVRAHPDRPEAAQARLALGQAELRRGNAAGARVHWQSLVAAHSTSMEAAEALLLTGRTLELEGEWSEAAVAWSQLANHGLQHPWQTEARLGLARAWSMKGDGHLALSILESLEQLHPLAGPDEVVERLLAKARALQVAGRAVDALDALRAAARLDPLRIERPDALELHAGICAAAGLHGEAARLWFASAAKLEGAARARHLAEAAREADLDGDLLGLLFLERVAKGSSASTEVEHFAAKARGTLGSDASLAQLAASARLERARELRAEGACARALVVAEPLVAERGGLDEDAWLLAVELAARCADEAHGVERAVLVVKEALARTNVDASRRRLCLVAGELYEAREMWDLAADAFGGQLR